MCIIEPGGRMVGWSAGRSVGFLLLTCADFTCAVLHSFRVRNKRESAVYTYMICKVLCIRHEWNGILRTVFPFAHYYETNE